MPMEKTQQLVVVSIGILWSCILCEIPMEKTQHLLNYKKVIIDLQQIKLTLGSDCLLNSRFMHCLHRQKAVTTTKTKNCNICVS